MSDHSDLNNVIAELFPGGVASFFSAGVPIAAQLLPEELPATKGMAEKRLDEFRHGRYCARIAMQALGIPPVAITKGADRAPLWPEGVVGSISHTGTAAAAAVTRSATLESIGLDMETDEPLPADIIDMICLPGENPGGDGARAKLLFSIKEAVYKCLYPVVRQYIDFREMEIRTDLNSATFLALSHTPNCSRETASRLKGRFLLHSGYVVSAAWLQ